VGRDDTRRDEAGDRDGRARRRGKDGVKADNLAGLPAAAAVGALFRTVVQRWHEREPPLDWARAESLVPVDLGEVEGQSAHLGLINCFQWHLEDACRASYDDLARLGALKRQIDDSNARRVARIDAIDRRVVEVLQALAPADERAPACLVTPANVLDRLSILELKRYHAAGGAGDGSARGLRLAEQIDDLARGFDDLIADLAAGRQRLRFYRTDKLYGAHG
jgi:hypothetical protein